MAILIEFSRREGARNGRCADVTACFYHIRLHADGIFRGFGSGWTVRCLSRNILQWRGFAQVWRRLAAPICAIIQLSIIHP